MRTQIPAALRDDPDIVEMDAMLRKCVHCGFCLAACPTYSLNGDERTSPRGRIYLIKSLIEGTEHDAESILGPIDSCLSCLACASACPSGVDYQHFIDLARPRVEKAVRRPTGDALLRTLLIQVLPYPRRFRAALALARVARPFAGMIEAVFGRRVGTLLRMAPARARKGEIIGGPHRVSPVAPVKGRVGLLAGCAQQVLRGSINESTIRILSRMGLEIVVPEGVGCCGALVHHMGKEDAARGAVAVATDAWIEEHAKAPLDAIVINAAGCGTHVKDYGYVLRATARADTARTVADLARDVTEVVARFGLPPAETTPLPRIVYHDACSLLNGQNISDPPRQLLRAAGFEVLEVPGRHFCCGSAGSYNLLQPEIADELNARRVAAIESTGAQAIATGNIGCLEQLSRMTKLPVVHTIELLDWATGGPKPANLA